MRHTNRHSLVIRGLIAIAFALPLSIGAAVAEDSNAPAAVTTLLKLKSSDGGTESLRFDGALAVGESRGYETDAGTPVLVTRTKSGLSIELPTHTVQLDMPDHAEGDIGTEVNVERRVRVDGDGAHETRVVVLQGQAGAADAEHVEQLLEGHPEALEALAQSEADGDREIVIVRKQRREETPGE